MRNLNIKFFWNSKFNWGIWRGNWSIIAVWALINWLEPIKIEMLCWSNCESNLSYSCRVCNWCNIFSQDKYSSWNMVGIIALINYCIMNIISCNNDPLCGRHRDEQISMEELKVICKGWNSGISRILSLHDHINQAAWLWRWKYGLNTIRWKYIFWTAGSLVSKKPGSVKFAHIKSS